MRVALDTNAYRAAAEGAPRVADILRRADEIWLPCVVLAELRAGFALGTRGRANEAALARFLNSPRVEVLCIGEPTTHQYARVFAQLRREGTPIPTNDLWIAALAIEHDLLLVTDDAHFARVPQVVRI